MREDEVMDGADVQGGLRRGADVRAYARGDATAVERLYERWSERLCGYLARTADPVTAEELFQTLWMRIHAAKKSYAPGRTFALFAIAANMRREEWRRRGRRPGETRPDATKAA